MTKKVLITGGTGLVGTALTELLVEKDYTVTILTRNKNLTSKHPNITYGYWDINKGVIDKEELLSANYMVHLAGAGIADKPWSKKVLITCGTGLVGTALTELLVEKDYTVTILTRNKNLTSKHPNITYGYWDINKGVIDKEELLSANYMVHLAGAGIADKPWSK